MRDDRLRVVQMLECVDRILEYTEGGREEFLESRLIQDAVFRNFEVLGEAAGQVPQRIRELGAEIPWGRLVGFRNVLIHDYEAVLPRIVWQRVAEDLEPLRGQLLNVLQELGGLPEGPK